MSGVEWVECVDLIDPVQDIACDVDGRLCSVNGVCCAESYG
jgi:hypothetical protein